MPVIRLSDVPDVSVDTPSVRLVMKKAIGSAPRDPQFTMPVSTDSVSVTHIRHWSRHQRMRCEESDRVMFVVEGETTVQIGAEPPELLGIGDFALIPRGTAYEFAGDFTYLVINAPAFKEGSDILDFADDVARTSTSRDQEATTDRQ